jgi:type IV secretory pathway VirD2 relaxase
MVRFLPVSAAGATMSTDDENHFRPKPGRIRSDAPRAGKTKSFLTQAKKIARQQRRTSPSVGFGTAAFTPAAPAGPHVVLSSGKGVKRGRGVAFVRSRNLGGGWQHRQSGARRVMVQQRHILRPGQNRKAQSHLRYIQRDGTSRDGERGQLYSATEDRANADTFLERGNDDRHQFRFIVSPEDGAELSDLTAYTRDLMSQMEGDLGTKLDWIAVNHYNTGHPHVHVIVRGKDELGEDLVINGDYIVHGVRERASTLATLELGPVSEIEQTRKLTAEIDQERFTRIDRAMAGEADGGFLDLRHEPGEPKRQFERTLRLRRLAKLGRMNLATEHAPGVWELNERLEPTLRELGERSDIIRTMQKSLAAEGLERDPLTFDIHDTVSAARVTGRVLDKYLANELGDNLTVVVDGIDGRTHHISTIDPRQLEDAPIGSIIEIGQADANARPSDRAIAAIARDGIYRPSHHLEQAKFEGRVPGGDYEGYVDAHIRRLEALRRAGVAGRIDADQWRIPPDFEERCLAFDAGRSAQANVRVITTFDLESQIVADGATWLDRRLVSSDASDLAPTGFGQQVRDAMGRRREYHIDHGDAARQQDGRIAYRRNLLATLRTREIERIGSEMAASKSLTFRAAADGETVSGKFTDTTQLSSGKFAIVEKSHEFTLVPWRPVIERQLGREVMGVVRAGSVSWQLGRQRGLGL